MAKIFKDGSFWDEEWLTLEDEQDIPATGNLIVPIGTYLENPTAYSAREGETGVLIKAGDEVYPLGEHLAEIAIVAVEFPSFADGRGFSAARVLREQFDYQGDIRAVGNYILDQVPLARRCGVSSFEISKPEVLKALEAGEWPEVTKYLQPVGTVDEVPEGTRPWARRSRRDFQ
ncbi:DUF934 domain-containing protein, partial [Roseibium sp. TrichSKD4]|uniref:DUF934 domain-containing protein n=1 Tax=Roseibium sp. TrichSKD4 TaxID=744980 RepID=UPI0002DCF83D